MNLEAEAMKLFLETGCVTQQYLNYALGDQGKVVIVSENGTRESLMAAKN
jgi:hypothetical protein